MHGNFRPRPLLRPLLLISARIKVYGGCGKNSVAHDENISSMIVEEIAGCSTSTRFSLRLHIESLSDEVCKIPGHKYCFVSSGTRPRHGLKQDTWQHSAAFSINTRRAHCLRIHIYQNQYSHYVTLVCAITVSRLEVLWRAVSSPYFYMALNHGS